MQACRRVLHRRHRLTDRRAGSQVEAQRHRWELAEVVDRKRRQRRLDGRHLREGHFRPVLRLHVEPAQRLRSELV